jgi:hypothetical protein
VDLDDLGPVGQVDQEAEALLRCLLADPERLADLAPGPAGLTGVPHGVELGAADEGPEVPGGFKSLDRVQLAVLKIGQAGEGVGVGGHVVNST